ncbi:MAG: hypothetical protein RMJ98_13745 [Myxococcales bacterium]|nr:hypothetical protein [Polyangiaceae bacterium]MDW8250354.1 hypothetical protein [Myxococcales bacterium]
MQPHPLPRSLIACALAILLTLPLAIGCKGDDDHPDANGGSGGSCLCDPSSVCCSGCKPSHEKAD